MINDQRRMTITTHAIHDPRPTTDDQRPTTSLTTDDRQPTTTHDPRPKTDDPDPHNPRPTTHDHYVQ